MEVSGKWASWMCSGACLCVGSSCSHGPGKRDALQGAFLSSDGAVWGLHHTNISRRIRQHAGGARHWRFLLEQLLCVLLSVINIFIVSHTIKILLYSYIGYSYQIKNYSYKEIRTHFSLISNFASEKGLPQVNPCFLKCHLITHLSCMSCDIRIKKNIYHKTPNSL